MIEAFKTFFRRKADFNPRLWPCLPEGQRIYAIGDIHGRADLLDVMLRKIAKDEAIRSPAETTIIFLGDLIDRGPESAQVVNMVLALSRQRKVRAIVGNHEEMLLASFCSDQVLRRFLAHGGKETIVSYLRDMDAYNRLSIAELRESLSDIIPVEHLVFLRGLEDLVCIGPYVFVHAGIRPGVKIEAQQPRDMHWIRDAFLSCTDDFGCIVVHGHTISDKIDLRPNRIGIDTGAYLHGKLSAIAIEGHSQWFLEACV